MTDEDIMWKCEMCGKVRPDALISVITYPLEDLPGGERNLKYCNDNAYCREEATIKARTKQL